MKIVITGASSGIGAALANYYAKSGVTLALLARNSEALDCVATACRLSGATAIVYPVDVIDGHAMRATAQNIVDHIGLPDIVIANAGIRIEDPADELSSVKALDIMMVNYIGVILSFEPFIQAMKLRKSGKLVAISSIAALRATPNSGIYSASKGAVNLWTEALRLRLAPFNITVTTACSGFVRTAMTADLNFYMPGILTAAQAAEIIADATASGKSRIMFPWQSRVIWSIFYYLPGGIYDRMILLAKKWWPNRKPSSR